MTDIRGLLGRSFRNPLTGKVYRLVSFRPDPAEPDRPEFEYLGEVTVRGGDGREEVWFGHEIELDFRRGRLEPVEA